MAEDLRQKFLDFAEYLEEIRQKIYGIIVIFCLCFLVGFFFSGRLLSFLIKFFNLSHAAIVSTSPFQFLDLAMSVGLFLAFICCLPLIVFQLYAFAKAGLNKRERAVFLLTLPLSLLLFLVGFSYGFGILYYALDAIAELNISLGIQNLWDIGKFVYEISLTSVLLGLLFEFPIILTFLVSLGILNAAFLKSNRRLAIAVMFIITALLPPTDGVSLIIMVIPMIIIYELTIIINQRLFKNKKSVVYNEALI